MRTGEDLSYLRDLRERLKADPFKGADEEALEIIRGEETGADWLDAEGVDDYIGSFEWTADRLKYLLDGYELSAPYGYRFDGYGNIATVTIEDIASALDDIISEIELENY